jgi:hypothetical protein
MGGGNSKKNQRRPTPQSEHAPNGETSSVSDAVVAVIAVSDPVAREAALTASSRSVTRDLHSLTQGNSAQQRPASQGSSGPSAIGQVTERPPTRDGPAPASERASVTPDTNAAALAKRKGKSRSPHDDNELANREREGSAVSAALDRSATRDLRSHAKRDGDGSMEPALGRSATSDINSLAKRKGKTRSPREDEQLTRDGEEEGSAASAALYRSATHGMDSRAGSRSPGDEDERRRITSAGGSSVRGADASLAPPDPMDRPSRVAAALASGSASPQSDASSSDPTAPEQSIDDTDIDERDDDVRELREQVWR